EGTGPGVSRPAPTTNRGSGSPAGPEKATQPRPPARRRHPRRGRASEGRGISCVEENSAVAKDSSAPRIQANDMGSRRPLAARSTTAEEPSLHAEDHALVARVLGGDQAAFDDLVERYSSPLYRFSLA